MIKVPFAWMRLRGLIGKEFIQLKRDRMTFAMLIGIPFIQLMLFGYAINADPKELPTAIVRGDDSQFVRTFLKSLENTGYFKFTVEARDYDEAAYLMKSGAVQYIVTIPEDFTRLLVRGERPQILLEVDATDPIASSGAMSAALQVVGSALDHDLKGVVVANGPRAPPVELVMHRQFNPENLTHYNTVPGLIGVILTMTLVMITALSLARERERGTLENLYAMPLKPSEVMLGKIVPFVVGATIQVTIVLAAARILFEIPMFGSFLLLSASLVLFIIVNLAIGFTFSTVATNQLQAMQMSMFFFLPSILLSGFVFPFLGMPQWAQVFGSMLPMTYFLRIIRGIMLKGAEFPEIWPHIWPLLVILSVATFVAMKRYKATLD